MSETTNKDNTTAPQHPNPASLTAERGAVIGAAGPAQYQGGKLTRQGMESVIASGGSVMHGGKVITRIEHLPDEADLAQGDEQATQQALDGLAAQRAQLDAQEQKLLASRGRAKENAKAQQQANKAAQHAAGGKGGAAARSDSGDDEPTFGDEELPLSHFDQYPDEDAILDAKIAGVGPATAEKIVAARKERGGTGGAGTR
jgi:hypothetical protein